MYKDNAVIIDKKRIVWIDELKGFGIILVTLGHLNPCLPLETHIYSFHMCLFFFLSGYLFKQSESFGDYVVKRIRNLLIPFIIWDLLASIVDYSVGSTLESVLRGFFTIKGALCWNAPIWFLLVLFMTEILYAAIIKISHTKTMPLFVFLTGIVLWFSFGSYNLTLKFNLVPLSISFYSLGHYFQYAFDNKKFSNTFIITCLAITGTISIILGAILNIRISYTGGTFGNYLYCIPASIAGTLFYYMLFKTYFSKGTTLLGYIGKNSMIIMITQYWFFNIYDLITQKLFNINIHNTRSTIKAVLVTVVTIAFILFFDYVFKKIFSENKRILKIGSYLGIR